ncbi:MAG TPA: sigma-70 family RNA polymerase sigma factor [Longimicrobiales bacterium]|nr:sigma-70 family RNA polymerase sigma factor [Longimicrobiales bacterium]
MDRQELEQQLDALHADSFAWALTCCDYRRADAEDALQTAYVRVLDGTARYRGEAAFRTWLFGVIRHTASEERRRWWWRRRANGNGTQHAAVTAAAATAADDMRIELEQEAARLGAALRTLPRRQREVLELVFYHELTIAEAGAVMGVSLGSARTHYERGKKNMQQRLEPPS